MIILQSEMENAMGLSAEIRKQLIESFKTEQSEHVQKINEGLLALEKNPKGGERQTLLDEIFREAHSLKGAARAVGITTIESLGHALEGLLLSAKEGHLAFSPELFDLLYQALDAVELVMGQLESGKSSPPAKVLVILAQLEETAANVAGVPGREGTEEPEGVVMPAETGIIDEARSEFSPALVNEATLPSSPASTPDPEPEPDNDITASAPTVIQSDETIRVSVSKLDALMAQFSELLGAKILAEQRLAEVRQMQTFAADWQKEWTTLRSHYSRLVRNGHNSEHNGHHNGYTKDMAQLVDFVTSNQEQLRTFNIQSNTLYRQLSNDTMRLSLIIDELQEEIKRVRMLPLSTITMSFGRMIRDLAREQAKQIALTITGGDTELDKRVLEQIKDPLIHLLRNAVDHGVETPEKREQAGKQGIRLILNCPILTVLKSARALKPIPT